MLVLRYHAVSAAFPVDHGSVSVGVAVHVDAGRGRRGVVVVAVVHVHGAVVHAAGQQPITERLVQQQTDAYRSADLIGRLLPERRLMCDRRRLRSD